MQAEREESRVSLSPTVTLTEEEFLFEGSFWQMLTCGALWE